MLELNQIYCGDNLDLIKQLDDICIDLTVTSPPYDNLRTYNGYSFQFEPLAKELYRVTKVGGVIVWIVNDATINGSETGTSFRHALYFKEIGFNLHDTMIWNKGGFTAVGSIKYRYGPAFEYMFILSKGYPKTFNPLKDRPNKQAGGKKRGNIRLKDGTMRPLSNRGAIKTDYGIRFNVWMHWPEQSPKERCGHPAQFPKALARDHILSWSNVGDTVLDPFMGSGTTSAVCKETDRNYIGFEISQEYCDIANKRLRSIQKILL